MSKLAQVGIINFNQKRARLVLAPMLLFLSVFLRASNSNLISNFDENGLYKFGPGPKVRENRKFSSRSLLHNLDWRYTGFHMAYCDTDEDCAEVGPHMICIQQICKCKVDYTPVERLKFICYPKVQIFGPCELTEQCVAMNNKTYCNPSSRCTCSLNYYFDGRQCSIRYDSHNLKAQEVYKAAVVAAACFIVAIVGIFVACIVRRSFCRREQHIQQSGTTRNSDVFSISDEIAALRAVDKPPSYEEVLQIERTFYGIPPPEYTVSRNDNTSPHNLPMTCSSVQTHTLEQPLGHDVPIYSQSTCTSANISTETNLSKDIAVGSATSTEAQNVNLSPTALSSALNFLAVAEVLPASSENNLHSVGDTNGLFLSRLPAQYLSSTPPPRLHHPPFVMTHMSSSLPASPVLNSHRLASHLMLRSGLFKQNQHSPVLPLASLPDSSSLPSRGATSCHSSNAGNNKPNTSAAYDNPGFISDSQDVFTV